MQMAGDDLTVLLFLLGLAFALALEAVISSDHAEIGGATIRHPSNSKD
jgi:hypothetical protein